MVRYLLSGDHAIAFNWPSIGLSVNFRRSNTINMLTNVFSVKSSVIAKTILVPSGDQLVECFESVVQIEVNVEYSCFPISAFHMIILVGYSAVTIFFPSGDQLNHGALWLV